MIVIKQSFFLFFIITLVACKTADSVSVLLSSDQNGIDTLIIKKEFDGREIAEFLNMSSFLIF